MLTRSPHHSFKLSQLLNHRSPRSRAGLSLFSARVDSGSRRFFSNVSDEQIDDFSLKVSDTNTDEALIGRGEVREISDLISYTQHLHEHGMFGAEQLQNHEHIYKASHPPVPTKLRYWFRGHSDIRWGLLPSIHRYSESDQHGLLEGALVTCFTLNHAEYSLNKHGLLKILSTMQHYRYPTRLLDWTSNIMSAAYFAVAELDDNDGVIWILDPYALNLQSSISQSPGIALDNYFDVALRCYSSISETYDELLKAHGEVILRSSQLPEQLYQHKIASLERLVQFVEKLAQDTPGNDLRHRFTLPVAVEPGRINPRIIAQQGKFTVCSGKQYFSRTEAAKHGSLFAAPKSMLDDEHRFIRCIRIKAEHKAKLRRQLRDILNIDEDTMMVDLDYHGRVATSMYSFQRNV
jgi:FRG domain